MATTDLTPRIEEPEALGLRPGPSWDSFEQFRREGAKQLPERLGPGQLGRLHVKGREYVIMEAPTFTRLHGLAQEIGRLRRGLLLLRQAVQLVMRTDGERLALEHLRDLTFQLPELQAAAPTPVRELVFAEDERADEPAGAGSEEDFEVDPTRVPRPAFTAAG